MSKTTRQQTFLLAGAALLFLTAPPVGSQGPVASPKVQPRLEPVAETRLLMEGLAHANFRGLDRLLGKMPADNQSWTFARGQALLIAETANLLMLRPPRNEGQRAWFERAMDLRSRAAGLAQTLTRRDYEKSRAGLVALANACNQCHQTFRVKAEIVPFAEKSDPGE